MSPLVVVENTVLDRLSANQEARKAFPVLQKLHNLQSGGSGKCSSCERKRRRKQLNAARTQAKQQLAALPDDDQQRLKRILNADKVRVAFRAEDGKVVDRTF